MNKILLFIWLFFTWYSVAWYNGSRAEAARKDRYISMTCIVAFGLLAIYQVFKIFIA